MIFSFPEYLRFETELGSEVHTTCVHAYVGLGGFVRIGGVYHELVDARYTEGGRVSWLAVLVSPLPLA